MDDEGMQCSTATTIHRIKRRTEMKTTWIFLCFFTFGDCPRRTAFRKEAVATDVTKRKRKLTFGMECFTRNAEGVEDLTNRFFSFSFSRNNSKWRDKMPNPYVGNEDAAEYLLYFASSTMEKESVHRLYDDGIQKKRSALMKAEAELYPCRAPVVRTKEEIESYLERLRELSARRQRKLVSLEQQLYPQPALHMDPKKLEAHVKHMYVDQMKRIRRKEAQTALIRGDAVNNVATTKNELQERDVNKEREAKWRPVAASPQRQDGKATLLYDSPRRRAVSASGRRKITPEEQKEKQKYFAELAKPLRVYSKVTPKPKDDFNVYVKPK